MTNRDYAVKVLESHIARIEEKRPVNRAEARAMLSKLRKADRALKKITGQG